MCDVCAHNFMSYNRRSPPGSPDVEEKALHVLFRNKKENIQVYKSQQDAHVTEIFKLLAPEFYISILAHPVCKM